MTGGESFGALALALFGVTCLIIAGLTDHGGYAFHMVVFALASVLA
ncbi:MAG: hypothetical protein ING72_02285, partial [Methylobacterium sp.]|nr:hypothetical protein [Methylobacterium sp.]